ncbi:MAG: GHKL domain-containing protein [Leptolyngbya sp. SIO3F4]|nr:GHKL domain-containing protein [Leptolyngbya sp. SIO3F4]
MENNQTIELLRLTTAFQTWLKHCQTTCLLIDRQNRLIHTYDDALNVLKVKDNDDVSDQNVLILLPSNLQKAARHVLKQAQQHGTATQITNHIELSDGQPYTVIITARLHTSDRIEDFLTLLIERAEKEISERSVDAHTTELIEVNERLRAKVLEQKQTEQELANQAQALARSNESLEEFAYIVSHDLQEPLRAMTAFSQLLEQRYGAQLETAAKRYLTHIVDGGTRMQAMIDGILELSRINTKVRTTHTTTNLEQALDTVLENLKLTRLETKANITHNTLPTLYVDKNHIVQLLQNLVGNAIKFRGSELPKILITAQQQPQGWLFSVKDNGVGIPKNQQQRIFKLFQRLHSQREYQGYGIGLAICKKIVEHYQGKIWLKSAPGEGTTFYFTLIVDAEQNED